MQCVQMNELRNNLANNVIVYVIVCSPYKDTYIVL